MEVMARWCHWKCAAGFPSLKERRSHMRKTPSSPPLRRPASPTRTHGGRRARVAPERRGVVSPPPLHRASRHLAMRYVQERFQAMTLTSASCASGRASALLAAVLASQMRIERSTEHEANTLASTGLHCVRHRVSRACIMAAAATNTTALRGAAARHRGSPASPPRMLCGPGRAPSGQPIRPRPSRSTSGCAAGSRP